MSATLEEARRVLAGVTVTPVSPFTSRGDLDLEAAAAHAERLAVSGIRSVAVAGNTGEFYALTTEEVDRLVGVWREAAGPGMFLWMGVSGSQADVRRRLVSARERGAQGALLHSPPHTYLSEGGMKRYLETVLDEAQAEGLVVALYKRDARVPDSVIVALSRHPALAGVKYAVNDLMAVSRLVHDLDGTVPVVCGTAEVWAAAFATVGARASHPSWAGWHPGCLSRYRGRWNRTTSPVCGGSWRLSPPSNACARNKVLPSTFRL